MVKIMSGSLPPAPRVGRPLKYPFDTLKAGEFFFVPSEEYEGGASVRAMRTLVSRRHHSHPDVRFSVSSRHAELRNSAWLIVAEPTDMSVPGSVVRRVE